MEENKRKYEELKKYMKKIQDSMKISYSKQDEISDLTKKLYSETRIMMVEKEKEEIKAKEDEKKEFDEMTTQALINAKRDIVSLKENIEKDYMHSLLEMQQQEKRIQDRYVKMLHRALDYEIEMLDSNDKDKRIKKPSRDDIQRIRKNELEALKLKRENLQKEHETQVKNMKDWEQDIEKYAIDLNVLNTVEKMSVHTPSTPTTPVSTPTIPASTPTTPVSTPTTPVSTPTTPVSTPTTPVKNVIEITVGGKKGVIVSFNGNRNQFEERISSRDLRKDVGKLSREEKLDYIKEIMGGKINAEPGFENKIKANIAFMDDAILSSLYQMNLDEERDEDEYDVIKIAMEAYVRSTIDRKPIPGVNIVYDRSDLAKVNIPIVSKMFKGRFSRKQKDYLNQMSEKTANWTNYVGVYAKNPIKRFLEDRNTKKLSSTTKTCTFEQNEQFIKNLQKIGRTMTETEQNKTQEQIAQENARAEARRQARQQNGGEGS